MYKFDSGCCVHFVGSVPLATGAEVMRTLGGRFGRALRRVPDGETGERTNWLQFQEEVFAASPDMETVPAKEDNRNAAAKRKQTRQFRVRPGHKVTAASFGSLGYTDSALASWKTFSQLAAEGAVSGRFMVAVPSPYNVISWAIADESRTEVEAAYQAKLLQEVAAICAAIPADKLAIQWDCAHDMQAFDGARVPWFTPAKEGIIQRLAFLGDQVPAGVDMGYHLCYGSFGGKHFVEPRDAGAMVELTNGIAAALHRKLDFVHMPVPIERDDDAYYQPLAGLRVGADTELYLGLVHDKDGVEGTRKRIAVAKRHVPHFGIASECGFGRRPVEEVPVLLDVHQQAMQ